MKHYVIKGPNRVRDKIVSIEGAKNNCLPLMASSVLFDDPVTFTNVPLVQDVITMCNLLSALNSQVIISENQEDLVLAKKKLESVIKEKIYIQFELPNYKLRIGNFSSRKKAELYRAKIVRLGYRSSWVIPTLIELDS